MTRITLATLCCLLLGGAATLVAQEPPEPWGARAGFELSPSLLEALEALFAEASAGDEAAFRARFTDASVERLEGNWADARAEAEEEDEPAPPGSWSMMMASLVARDGSPPNIIQIALDDDEEPEEAIVTLAIDGREHTLYLTYDEEREPAWRVDVRDRLSDALTVDLGLRDDQERSIFEITFGASIAAPGKTIFDYDDRVEPAPTTSLWMMGEVFALTWLRVGLIYDLPLSPQILEVDGELQSELVPSRLMAGVTWAPLFADFATRSRLELQFLTYMGLTIEDSPRPVPLIGARLAFLQDAYEGVNIYLGLYYEANIDILGVMYGSGYRF